MSSVQCTHLNGSLYLSHTSFISFDLDSKLLVSRKRSFSMMSKYLKVISSSKTSRPDRSLTFELTSTFSFANLARKVTQEAIAMRRSANRAKPRPGILSFNSGLSHPYVKLLALQFKASDLTRLFDFKVSCGQEGEILVNPKWSELPGS